MKTETRDRHFLILVVLVMAIGYVLRTVCWHIPFMPTDACRYYLPAAKQLFQLGYISDIHSLFDESHIRWLHGKEVFIVLSALMQRVMSDTETLRPLFAVCLGSFCGSVMLLYSIGRYYWGSRIAFACSIIFLTSLWPYMYILFVKHQPVGLFFVLLTIWFIRKAGQVRYGLVMWFLAGVSFSAAIFSSNVTPAYVFFIMAAGVYHIWMDSSQRVFYRPGWGRFFLISSLFGIGFLCLLVFLNAPDVMHNLRQYWIYIQTSAQNNHFSFNLHNLYQWMDDPIHARGGLLWVWRYCWLIMPVLFPVYLLVVFGSLLYVLKYRRQRYMLGPWCIIFVLSISPILLTEGKQIAQYGANYYPFLMGIIFFLGCAAKYISVKWDEQFRSLRIVAVGLAIFCIVLNGSVSVYAFVTDVYPTRMSARNVVEYLHSKQVRELSFLVTSRSANFFKWNIIRDLYTYWDAELVLDLDDARTQLAVTFPTSGSTIYNAAFTDDTDSVVDTRINRVVHANAMRQAGAVGFPSLAASRYWLHEEEVMSYRRLILGHKLGFDRDENYFWVLDVPRFKQYADGLRPMPLEETLEQPGPRAFGRASTFARLKTLQMYLEQSQEVSEILFVLSTVGDPQDSVWIRVFAADPERYDSMRLVAVSERIPADSLQTFPEEISVSFPFFEKVFLQSGFYIIQLYRSGSRDDQNFYMVRYPEQNVRN